jgi:hypothetical protein
LSEPKVNETKPSETKLKKMVRRSVPVTLGIACILLIAGMGGAIARASVAQGSFYGLQPTMTIEKTTYRLGEPIIIRFTIPLTITTPTGSFVEDMIMSDPSAWVNSTVLVEGIIDPLVMTTGNSVPPWDYALSSNGYTIGVYWQGTFYNGEYVTVLGVVTAGHLEEWPWINGTFASGPLVYFIEAESIELL